MDAFLITCEHGGNRIPAAYRSLFIRRKALLATHRGYDAGALAMADSLSITLRAPLVSSTVSRLLVDLNRSVGHPQLFSEATRGEPAAVRKAIVQHHYRPYRDKVEDMVNRWVAKGRRVIHLSSHSFTPALHGEVRTADAGLLYDPARSGEVELCARWKAALAACSPALRVRRNYPYAGKGDGLTAHLRRRFAPREYIGIELEINQAIVSAAGRPWSALRAVLAETFHGACANGD
jgi:predicted N-formylglutamate amidohydrolase